MKLMFKKNKLYSMCVYHFLDKKMARNNKKNAILDKYKHNKLHKISIITLLSLCIHITFRLYIVIKCHNCYVEEKKKCLL